MNYCSFSSSKIFLLGFFCALCQCSSQRVIPDRRPPDRRALQVAIARKCAVVVSSQKDLHPWLRKGFSRENAPKDGQAGTASPVTADGYLLTADHVIHQYKNRYIHVVYGTGSQLRIAQARVVWRAPSSDLALLHAPIATPFFYHFSSPDRPIAEGTSIFHGGLSTGLSPLYGSLNDTIPSQNFFSPPQRFRMDIPLVPGDSGGPILDNNARLIGVNSSVEFLVPMETPIFTESHGVRPNVRHILKTIERDRRR